jgi:hypothetical protein
MVGYQKNPAQDAEYSPLRVTETDSTEHNNAVMFAPKISKAEIE